MIASIPGGLRTRTTALAVAGLALTGLLAACGGGGDATTTAGGSASASPTGGPAGGPGDGRGPFGGLDLQAVQSCLSAAGITMPPFPTGRGNFTGTDRPSFSRNPSFTGRPTGTAFPGGGRGGAFAVLQSPEARAALEACGITLPTFTPRNRPSQPTASPSS